MSPEGRGADDESADAVLAQLPVHVVDEQFGKEHRELANLRVGIVLLQPQQHRGEHHRHRFEPAVDAVLDLSVEIPIGVAAQGDDAVIGRARDLARVLAAEQAGEDGHGACDILQGNRGVKPQFIGHL